MRISNASIDRIYCNRTVRSSDYRMAENHSHNYYEIFYVEKGNTRFFINDKLFDLRPGDFIIIPPRVFHYNRYIVQTTRVNIYFREIDLKAGNDFILPDLKETYLNTIAMYHTPGSRKELLDNIMDRMIHEDPTEDSTTSIMMRLLLQEFFVTFNRHSTVNVGISKQLSEEGDISIQEAAQYISYHYNEHIDLTNLSKRFGLSPSYFSKRFHLITGMGMKEYLNYIRLKHAEYELLSTSHSIYEIAKNCGYSDSNYFKDVFKKMYLVSPRDYRKSKKTDFVEDQDVVLKKIPNDF